MTLYVDALREHSRMRGLVRGVSCHLATDGAMSELHAFAKRIGLPARAFHPHEDHPHYDLNPDRRAVAVEAGAIEVTSKELVKRCFRRGGPVAKTSTPTPPPTSTSSPVPSVTTGTTVLKPK